MLKKGLLKNECWNLVGLDLKDTFVNKHRAYSDPHAILASVSDCIFTCAMVYLQMLVCECIVYNACCCKKNNVCDSRGKHAYELTFKVMVTAKFHQRGFYSLLMLLAPFIHF